MSEYTARNVESEVLKSATDKLQRAFRNSLKTLAGKFYAENLIPTEVWNNCCDSTINKDTSTEALVSALQDRVSNEQSAYYKIVTILESETGVSYIVKGIEDKREEIEAIEKEKKEEFERKKAELKNLNLQETPSHTKLFYLQERPDNLPETPLSMRSSTAPSRNAPTSSFPQSHSGPAMYNRSFPTASSWSRNSSSTQAGDTFPLPASSPGELNSKVLQPVSLKMPFQALPPVSTYGAEQVIRHSLVTGMWPVGIQEYEYSMNRDHQPENALPDNLRVNTHLLPGGILDYDQNTANKDQLKTDSTEVKMDGQLKHQKEQVHEETCQLGNKKPNEDVTEQNKSVDKDISKSSPNKDVTIDRLQPPQRSDSICSNTSENSCEGFSTPNGSLSLDSSSESIEDLQRARAKSCNKCAFFKQELQRLDEKIAELEKKCKQNDQDLQQREFHHNEQIKVITSELQVKHNHVTAVNHRHQVMEFRVAELQKKVVVLTQMASSDRVLGLEATIKLQEEEIRTLKLERDRERRQKEIAILQKETEREEKETERKRFESERECRIAFETEVYQLRIELKRTRSFQCEENIFCYDANDMVSLAALLQSSYLSGSNPSNGTGTNSSTHQAATDWSSLPGCNQSIHPKYNPMMPQGHSQALPLAPTQGRPQGYNQALIQGHNQTLPQGYNQGMPQHQNQGMPQGQNPVMPQGQNQGMPQGQNQGIPQHQNQGMPQGQNPVMPQGQNQGMSQQQNQSMPQGRNQGMPQRLNQDIPQGDYQGMLQGHNQGMSQGHKQSVPQGVNQSMAQGQNQNVYGVPAGSEPNPALHNWNNQNSGTVPAFSQQTTTTFPGQAASNVNGQNYQSAAGHLQSAKDPSINPAESTLTAHPQRPANSTTANGEAIEARGQENDYRTGAYAGFLKGGLFHDHTQATPRPHP